MGVAGYILAAIGGAVVTGIGFAVYEAEKSPATPATQAAVTTTLVNGQAVAVNVPTGAQFTIMLPSNASAWTKLTDPNGRVVTPSGTNPATNTAVAGTWSAQWTAAFGMTANGSVSVTTS